MYRSYLRHHALAASALALVALVSPALVSPALAQDQPADDLAEDGYEVDELVVSAQAGSVIGDIPPELQLSARDIRAYGVSNVAELLDALAPQTSSGRGSGGRPVILVGGRRISSYSEIRDFPTEAIARVDILPEEVALKYGYRADQRVVNFVLRPRFRAITAETDFKTPTQGAGEVYEVQVNALRIQGERRLLLDAKASTTNRVLESQRDLADPSGDAAFRTLQPRSQSATLTGLLVFPVKEGVTASLNASLDASRNDSLQGLASGAAPASDPAFALSDPVPLKRRSDAVAGHAGASVNGALQGWRWSLTANADQTDTTTVTDRSVAGAAFRDKSRSISRSADAELVANGVLANLKAGAVSTTLKAGFSTSSFDTRALRSGVSTRGDLSRDVGSFQANLDVPLASKAQGVRGGLGELSGNLNLAVDRLSDFGGLTTFGYGLNWSPWRPLRLIGSVTRQEGAPTVQQLGAPVQVTQGVRVFDFVRGETVEVTRVEGGAPGLSADDRTVMKLGLNFKAPGKHDITFSADWVRTEIGDVIAAFPTATSRTEAAFPDRFVRDAAGRLIQIDARPVNFDRRETEELRWGVNFRKSLESARPPGGRSPGDSPAQAGGERPRGAPGGARGRGFGGGSRGGVLRIGLYHTLRLTDEIRIRPGGPTLDLLGGDAIGNSGGQPRHEIDLRVNVAKNGYGLSLRGDWQSATTVRGSAVGDLDFSDLATLDLRLFADLGAQPWARRDYPWLRGARLVLSVDNLFDARPRVRTATGATPINFQPDYLDPLGRQVRISFRKVFF